MKIRNILLACVIASGLSAKNECEDKLFSQLSAAKGTPIYQLLDQVSSYCSFSIVVKDAEAERLLESKLGNTNLKNFTLTDILNYLLSENKLSWEFKDNILKVSYLVSKTIKVDYVATQRSAKSGVQTNTAGGATTTTSSSSSSSSSSGMAGASGASVTTDDKFDFWDLIEGELGRIMSQTPVTSTTQSTSSMDMMLDSNISQGRSAQPQARASTSGVIINRVAGLVTVTGSKDEVDRAQRYIDEVITRLHRQVLVDVNIYSVSLDKTNTIGVDWTNIYNFLNVSVSANMVAQQNLASIGGTLDPTLGFSSGQFFSLSSSVTLKDIVKFLQTQGNVKSISNPKVLTLNNQPAIIFSGETIYYPTVSGGTSGTATSGGTNPSVTPTPLPVGVTLDITPEILDDDSVILKINPTASSCVSTNCALQTVTVGSQTYNIAPNVSQKQLSSVVKVRDGEKIILGGLIKDKNEKTSTQLPILGDIPFFGYAFKQDVDSRSLEELVIIITPRIIKKEKAVTLKELGFSYDEAK